MPRYIVKATIMKMGRSCASCRQDFEIQVDANSSEEAIAQAKFASNADLETHKFKVNVVKEI